MLKGALQWSVYPQRTGSIYRRLWQPLQIGPCMLVLILPTPGGWKAEWTLAGKKVTQIFNPRPGRESNWGPQDWEAEILTTAPTPPPGAGAARTLKLWRSDPVYDKKFVKIMENWYPVYDFQVKFHSFFCQNAWFLDPVYKIFSKSLNLRPCLWELMSGQSKNHTLKGGTSPYSLCMG